MFVKDDVVIFEFGAADSTLMKIFAKTADKLRQGYTYPHSHEAVMKKLGLSDAVVLFRPKPKHLSNKFESATVTYEGKKNVKGTSCWRRRIRKVANDNNGYNFAVSNKNNFQRECDMTFNVAAIKFSEQIIDKKVVRTNQQRFTPIFCQQCTAVQGERRSHFLTTSLSTFESSGSSSTG